MSVSLTLIRDDKNNPKCFQVSVLPVAPTAAAPSSLPAHACDLSTAHAPARTVPAHVPTAPQPHPGAQSPTDAADSEFRHPAAPAADASVGEVSPDPPHAASFSAAPQTAPAAAAASEAPYAQPPSGAASAPSEATPGVWGAAGLPTPLQTGTPGMLMAGLTPVASGFGDIIGPDGGATAGGGGGGDGELDSLFPDFAS